VLLSYDPRGGNGHRDHVKVHQVGARAAELAGPVRVLEATVPRELVRALVAPVLALKLVTRYDPAEIRAAFTPRSAITHRVNVRRFAARKQAALAAHRSQVSGTGRSQRMLRILTKLPASVFALICGREWFVEPGGSAAAVQGDILQPVPAAHR
jgi:LmbE family N-acetylglucosaminyl deacetylase